LVILFYFSDGIRTISRCAFVKSFDLDFSALWCERLPGGRH